MEVQRQGFNVIERSWRGECAGSSGIKIRGPFLLGRAIYQDPDENRVIFSSPSFECELLLA
jgi:hypothetical protein